MTIDRLRLTILTENRVSRRHLRAEHGLSIWIEADDVRILFDTGASDVFLRNAAELNLDLSRADAVALSHGHYDHAGGLPAFFETFGPRPLYMHAEGRIERYSIHDGRSREIGIPVKVRQWIEDGRWPVNDVSEPVAIADGIMLTGPIPRRTDYEDTGGPFFRDAPGRTADAITDDQALVVRTPKGLVVVSGCAHSGIVNTIEYAMEIFDEKRVAAVIGGFHLVHASESRMQKTLAALKAMDPGVIAPLHCTGFSAQAALYQAFGAKYMDAETGTVIQL